MNNPQSSDPLPGADIEYARVLLSLGRSVPDVEKQLVGRGLTPETATTVVNAVLEGNLRAQTAPAARLERRLRLHRGLSAGVGLLTILLAFQFSGLSAGRTLLWVAIAMACVWFGEEIGSNERFAFSSTGPTPGAVVRLAGWVVLVVMLLYRLELVLIAGRG
jgi:hypothetical protein